MPKLETGGRAASGGAASGVDNVAELTVSVRLSVATGRAAVSKPSAEATTTGRLGFGREGSWMSCTSSRIPPLEDDVTRLDRSDGSTGH